MLIEKVELYLVENDFFTPWRTAYGSDPGNCAVFARMVSGEFEGWSESSPLPNAFPARPRSSGLAFSSSFNEISDISQWIVC